MSVYGPPLVVAFHVISRGTGGGGPSQRDLAIARGGREQGRRGRRDGHIGKGQCGNGIGTVEQA